MLLLVEISKVYCGVLQSILTVNKLQSQFCWTNSAVNSQLQFFMHWDVGCTSASWQKCQRWCRVAAGACGVTWELSYHLLYLFFFCRQQKCRQQKYIQAPLNIYLFKKKKKIEEHSISHCQTTFSVKCLLKCVQNTRLSRQTQCHWNVSRDLVEWVEVEVKRQKSQQLLK